MDQFIHAGCGGVFCTGEVKENGQLRFLTDQKISKFTELRCPVCGEFARTSSSCEHDMADNTGNVEMKNKDGQRVLLVRG